jgi:hypothetical protein
MPEARVAPSGVQTRAKTPLVCPLRTAVHLLSAPEARVEVKEARRDKEWGKEGKSTERRKNLRGLRVGQVGWAKPREIEPLNGGLLRTWE